MFQVIEPQEHHLYQSTINSFLKELQEVNALKKDQDLKRATFLLMEEKFKEIKGGILLARQDMRAFSPIVREYLHIACPQSKEIWTGILSLQISENITGRDFEKVCKMLYRILYENLIIFGVKENIPFLCLTMPAIEHLSIDMLGLWPYRLAIRPTNSSDGLFHGILSFSGTR